MTISMLLLYGAIAGFLAGIFISKHRTGCIALLGVPVAMLIYIGLWQASHPENIRSTSALDFLFGPLWPSLGALAGFYTGRAFGALRAWFVRRGGS